MKKSFFSHGKLLLTGEYLVLDGSKALAIPTQKGQEIPCIVGTPMAGEQIGKTVFDGEKEAAVFPGDLPKQASAALDGQAEGKLHFVRFRPPANIGESFPHIRLDRAIEFLLGDRFA